MRILMISSTFPYPPSRGGTEVRTFNLLKYLRQHHSVTVATQRQTPVTEEDIAGLRSWVDELLIFPSRDSQPPRSPGMAVLAKVGRYLEELLKGIPTNALYRYSAELQTWLDQAIRERRYDVITCEHSVNAVYLKSGSSQQMASVVDVHSAIYATSYNNLQKGASQNMVRDWLSLPTLYRFEKRYVERCAALVVTTPDDQQSLHQINPQKPITVIANGVDLDLFPLRSADPNNQDLIYVGAMDVTHNIDAVCFFAREVMPALRQRYPEVVFKIVGGNPVPEVLALKQCPGVVVTGRVPSMVEYLHQSAICVAPLRIGFGIKNKTLEAMAAGVPVVGSDRGLEGLAVDGPGVPLRALRANQVSEYVEAIGRLLADGDLRSQLSQHARALVEAEFTWEQAGKRYAAALERAVELSSRSYRNGHS